MERYRAVILGLVIAISLGLVVSCSNSPTNPQNQAQATQLLQANQDFLDQAAQVSYDDANENPGLARGWRLWETQYVRASRGAVLGGWRTLWNYVVIPPNTLKENQVLTFSVSIGSDGSMVFSVDRKGHRGDEINFQPGKTSKLMVLKAWLDEAPNVVVNLDDTDEEISVSETRTYYVAEVHHFSRWAWGWVVY